MVIFLPHITSSFSPPPPSYLKHGDKWHRLLQAGCPSCQPTNSTEGNTKHWPRPAQIILRPHPFFVYHHTPDGRGNYTLMLALWHQKPVICSTITAQFNINSQQNESLQLR